MNAIETRTITRAKVIVARDSMGDIDIGEYMARLEAAIRELPDLDDDAEIDVFAGDTSRYEGHYSDSEQHQYDAMTDRLHALAENVYAAMCRGE
jgi:hypothetical protein